MQKERDLILQEIKAFINTQCSLKEGSVVDGESLHKAYKKYCIENEETINFAAEMTTTAFCRFLMDCGIKFYSIHYVMADIKLK